MRELVAIFIMMAPISDYTPNKQVEVKFKVEEKLEVFNNDLQELIHQLKNENM